MRKPILETPEEIDRRARLFLVFTILVGVLAVLTAVIWPRLAEAAPARSVPDVAFAWSGDSAGREAQLEAFVRDWFSKCSPRKRHAALRHVPTVVAASEAGGVNPALVGAVVSLESTWDAEAVGQRGERGLMQIMGAPAGKSPRAQLDDGISRLRTSFERCGTTFGAVSYYGTGYTCRGYRGAERRLALAAKIETYPTDRPAERPAAVVAVTP